MNFEPLERYEEFAASIGKDPKTSWAGHAFCVDLDLHGVCLNSGKKLCPGTNI